MKVIELLSLLNVLNVVKCLSSAATNVLPVKMLEDLEKRANETMNKYDRIEEDIMNSNISLIKGSPSWYLTLSHEMTDESKLLSREALKSETMSIMMVKSLNMSPKHAVTLLNTMNLSPKFCSNRNVYSNIIKRCQRMNEKYRSHSGECNNVVHPDWGSSLQAYYRILYPEYEDGVSLPRINLPSAKLISNRIHSTTNDYKHPYLMAIASIFGQFIINDISHTPKMVLPNGQTFKCCFVSYKYFHPECFPIKTQDSIGCMEYSRSAPHPTSSKECKLGAREQINQATSFLDLSSVYGWSENASSNLRVKRGGLLNTQKNNLPAELKNFEKCRNDNDKRLPCFRSGDVRVNEHPGIALIYILFLREHNRVARTLSQLNPHWDDERLYQESRKISIAQLQHITFNEFLPLIFGERNLDRFDLRLRSNDFFTGYDSRINPTIPNSAALSGLFFINSLIPKTIDLFDNHSSDKFGERSLYSSFYAPQEFYEAGAIDRLIKGITAGHSRVPLGVNEILTDRYLHDGKTHEQAVDYVAQIIQQGRDHGLPAYIKWRSLCNILPPIQTFQHLNGTMSKDVIDKLQKVYKNVDDVDLVTGALSELPVEGSIMGPTLLCLLGRTFRNIRLGDRYWYENTKTPGAFTIQQLNEIRKSTMSIILCNNGDNLEAIQPQAFLLKDPFLNEVKSCSLYDEQINLLAWKEHQS